MKTKTHLFILVATALVISCGSKKESSPKQLPNIIYILADDLGYGDVSCLNAEAKTATPNIDKLSTEGMTFTDAHSGSSVCTPTRYGILTGRYCWRTSLKSGVLWPYDGPLIEPERLTVGELLKQNGYTTACIGKWHLGWEWPTTDSSKINSAIRQAEWDRSGKLRSEFEAKVDFSKTIENGPVTRGFDYYFGDDVPNFPPYFFIENDRTIGIPDEQKPGDMFGNEGVMLKGWALEKVMPAITQKAVDYIKNTQSIFKREADKPFFLYFALTAPHTPIAPNENFRGSSKAGAYGDFVQEVDWTVGQVLKALDEEGLTDNTLVIFTSDNGSPGRDGTNMSGAVSSVLKYGHNPSYQFRGTKADIWDGGHHVPFFVKWPGNVVPATKSNEIICHTDFMATCAAILGKELPNNAAEDSYNLLPLIKGENFNFPVREATVHHSGGGQFAIRKGKWKYIDGGGSGGWTTPKNNQQAEKEGLPPIQLYDLSTDIGETNNVYTEHPDVVDELKNLLEKYKAEERSVPSKNR